MKKYIILLAGFFFLLSCQKDNLEEIVPPVDNTCSIAPLTSIDYSLSSYNTFSITHPSISSPVVDGHNYGASYITLDYNNDGYLDLVGFELDFSNFVDREDTYTGYERKKLIKFFLGDCNGNLIEDNNNSDKFLGLVHGRKILLGDFNNDSFADIFLIGHGYDRAPYPGEYLKVLMSSSSGIYTETEFPDIVSFFHGGATGDIDNDGDLDVFVTDGGRGSAIIFENINGELNPSVHSLDQNLFNQMYTSELVDVDKDGLIDILVGGHDWTYGSSSYNNSPLLLYGDGEYFANNAYLDLPPTGIDGQGVVTDFEVIDIDDDGTNEIIVIRTGDGKDNLDNFYEGWSIQILKFTSNQYIDSTSEFIDIFEGSSKWFKWTKIEDIDNDGVLELINSSTSAFDYHEWELVGGKFIKK